MTLKYIAGTLPRVGVYTLVMGTLSRLPSGSWDLNASTVTSVDIIGAGKEYNYAAGGVGIVAGGMVAGPLGALVGGLVPKAFKDDVVQFVIRFRNGDVAHFAGSPGDYKRALRASYSGSVPTVAVPAPVTEAKQAPFTRAQLPAERIETRPKDNADAERLRAELADDRAANTAEDAEAVAAQRKEVLDGHPRLWFADAAVRQYVTAQPNETSAERKQREAQNERFRKEYKAALRVARKQHEKSLQQNHGLGFKERMRLLNEIQREFSYRTSK